VFFELRASNNADSFLSLYESCRDFISLLLDSGRYGEDIFSYLPNYAFQVTFAVGVAILKLLRSPLAEYIDFEAGKALFNSAITIVRKISVSNNDLPGRLAEVLAQLWTQSSLAFVGQENHSISLESRWQSVQPKLRSRMSMSIVYDSFWEWRKGFNKDVGRSERKYTNLSKQYIICIDTNTWIHIAIEQNSCEIGHASTMISQENDKLTESLMHVSQDLSLDDFLYDAFYPLNSMLEVAGNCNQFLTTFLRIPFIDLATTKTKFGVSRFAK
jgi:hypothetical protein